MIYLQWGLSALMLLLMGNKSKWGPRVGTINQLAWLAHTIGTKQWGLHHLRRHPHKERREMVESGDSPSSTA